jgi:hypothetical protein
MCVRTEPAINVGLVRVLRKLYHQSCCQLGRVDVLKGRTWRCCDRCVAEIRLNNLRMLASRTKRQAMVRRRSRTGRDGRCLL